MLQFFKFFNKFEVFSFQYWRYNFFHKTVSFQNKMKKLINFILFCLTCILNTLYADYQNSNEQNILFPRFYTLMSIFCESFFLMENFQFIFSKKICFCNLTKLYENLGYFVPFCVSQKQFRECIKRIANLRFYPSEKLFLQKSFDLAFN